MDRGRQESSEIYLDAFTSVHSACLISNMASLSSAHSPAPALVQTGSAESSPSVLIKPELREAGRDLDDPNRVLNRRMVSPSSTDQLLLLSPSDASELLPHKTRAVTALSIIKSGLKACKVLRKALESVNHSPQRGNLKLPQAPDTTCPICSNLYDCVMCLPMCLPCGHTLCSVCVMTLGQKANIVCPFDRSRFDMETESLPVNLSMAALAEFVLDSAQCPEHNAQIVGFCEVLGTPVCGLCDHPDEPNTHILLQSQAATELACQRLNLLNQQLASAWSYSKQLATWSIEIESLLLRLTVKFNGFSLLLQASPDDKRQSKHFTELLVKLRTEVEACQRVMQMDIQKQWHLYWNAGRLMRWQLLSYHFPRLPKLPNLDKLITALENWLHETR